LRSLPSVAKGIESLFWPSFTRLFEVSTLRRNRGSRLRHPPVQPPPFSARSVIVLCDGRDALSVGECGGQPLNLDDYVRVALRIVERQFRYFLGPPLVHNLICGKFLPDTRRSRRLCFSRAWDGRVGVNRLAFPDAPRECGFRNTHIPGRGIGAEIAEVLDNPGTGCLNTKAIWPLGWDLLEKIQNRFGFFKIKGLLALPPTVPAPRPFSLASVGPKNNSSILRFLLSLSLARIFCICNAAGAYYRASARSHSRFRRAWGGGQ
jgi:hypothetical protein